jgi:hypothetical protein
MKMFCGELPKQSISSLNNQSTLVLVRVCSSGQRRQVFEPPRFFITACMASGFCCLSSLSFYIPLPGNLDL